MRPHRLYKKEKLCSTAAVDKLFSPASRAGGNNSVMAYPWRAVWRVSTRRTDPVAQFLITVPKKRLRHAVDREAYRLGREALTASVPVDIAFIYVADTITPYEPTRRAVSKILGRISATLANSSSTETSEP